MAEPVPETAAAGRVCTVTLNPAIDLTAGLRGLRPGRVNRIAWDRADPGGKGVNVASFLADFGLGVTATGLLGEENAAPFEGLFAEKAIADRFVRLAGRTRTNVKLIDEAATGEDAVTDLNFPGPTATQESLDDLDATVDALAGAHEWFVLSGSLPAGVPEDIYRRLIDRLRGHGRKVALDASGGALKQAVDARLALMKPNIHELRELVGDIGESLSEIAEAAAALRERGIGAVVVSMGERGAVFVDADGAVHAAPPPVEVTSTVGAGDAMVAGLVLGMLRGAPIEDRARLATAFSAGALTTLGPRLPGRDVVERLADKVRITPLSQT